MTTLLWLRQTFRVADNAALFEAADNGEPILPVVCYSPNEEGNWPMGEASQWWFHHSLQRLQTEFGKHNAPLVLKKTDDVARTIVNLAKAIDTKRVVYDHRYEPFALEQTKRVNKALEEAGIEPVGIHTNLLVHPADWPNGQGKPYQVYSPFWKHLDRDLTVVSPPKSQNLSISSVSNPPSSDNLDDWQLLPTRDWADKWPTYWEPGEAGALTALNRFIDEAIETYKTDRDHPSLLATSKLSPHLHFGEISPQRIWHEVYRSIAEKRGNTARRTKDEEHFLKEVTWREFAYQILHAFPHTHSKPLREEFDAYPWADLREAEAQKALKKWQRGQTGYPIVDAGMRELYATGWMHNRVRMVVASFLIKHLRIHWLEGAKWFWDCLVDADLASNSLGWQWTAGCGPDAAPYFRIFNPMLQSKKFDKDCEYLRKWVPEIAALPDQYIHNPWDTPSSVMEKAGITLGVDYPHPMVDHHKARNEALEGYEQVKRSKADN